MKKLIVIHVILMLCFACAKNEPPTKSKPIDKIKVKIVPSTPQSRVSLEVNGDNNGGGFTEDKTLWSSADFLYVFELTDDGSSFTGGVFKYDYDVNDVNSGGATGSFKGTGISTGGSYMIVCTKIPNDKIILPTAGTGSTFSCTFTDPDVSAIYSGSFGGNPNEVQSLADNLVFVGTVTFDEDEAEMISMESPMSMIELRLTAADGVEKKVRKITISSDTEAFSSEIHIDKGGESISGNYYWRAFKSTVEFVSASEPLLSATPLKVRFLAFQNQASTEPFSMNVSIDFVDDSSSSYTTTSRTPALLPNTITVIGVEVKQ